MSERVFYQVSYTLLFATGVKLIADAVAALTRAAGSRRGGRCAMMRAIGPPRPPP